MGQPEQEGPWRQWGPILGLGLELAELELATASLQPLVHMYPKTTPKLLRQSVDCVTALSML